MFVMKYAYMKLNQLLMGFSGGKLFINAFDPCTFDFSFTIVRKNQRLTLPRCITYIIFLG